MCSINSLVKTIKYRFDHDSAKQILKQKYEAKMLFADSGGMWQAGPELIVILSAVTSEELVIIDTYGNPCRVDRERLLATANARWQEQMNAWENEFEELCKER
jgi:hypothetical protein